MSKTHAVDMNSFEAIVDEHPRVILDFWAGWCKPCQIFSPIFEKLAQENPDVYFGKVDTEAEGAKELAAAFQIRSIPTIMAFKQGELVLEHAGVLPVEMMARLLDGLRQESTEAPS